MSNIFKTTDRISKAIDQVINATKELESESRKQQALKVIHEMSVLHSDCLSDLKTEKVT